jgi:hypothetical protein
MSDPRKAFVPILLTLGCLVSCTVEKRDASEPRAAAPSATASTARPDADAPAAQRAPGTPLAFTTQPGWVEETPTSAMRKAQYLLPRAAADEQDASLVVFFFTTGAGTLAMNLERWAGQFEQPDGSPSLDVMTQTERKVRGMPVHDLALSGTYVAETAPGSGVRVREEGWRMLVSVIDSDHGSYYAKLVGPQQTVAHWEPSFRRFVSEVQ